MSYIREALSTILACIHVQNHDSATLVFFIPFLRLRKPGDSNFPLQPVTMKQSRGTYASAGIATPAFADKIISISTVASFILLNPLKEFPTS